MFNCADSAWHKIQSYATAFMERAEAADKNELLAAIEIMRSKIGTKKPYEFSELAENSKSITKAFWNPTVAAYCFCREDQRHVVATTITQTLDRLKVWLKKE